MADNSEGNRNDAIGQFQKNMNDRNNTNISHDDSDKVQEFEIQLTRLEAAKDELIRQMRTEKKNMIDKYESEVKRVKTEMNLMEKSLNEQISLMTIERNALEKSAAHEKDIINNKVRDLDQQLTLSIVAIEKLKTEHETIVNEKDRNLRQLHLDKDRIEQSMNNDIEVLRNETRVLNERLRIIGKEKDDSVMLINDMNDKIAKIQNDYKIVNNDLVNEKEKFCKIKTQFDDSQKNIDDLKYQLNEYVKENNEMKQKIQSLNTDLQISVNETEKSKIKINELQMSLKNAADERSVIMTDYEKVKNNLKEAEKLRFELSHELSNSQLNCVSIENESIQKESKINEMQMTFDRRIREMQTELETVKTKLIHSETDNEKLNKELNDVNIKVNEKENLLKCKKENSKKIKSENERLLNEILMIRNDLEMETKEKLENLQKNNTLINELRECQNENKELRKDYDEISKERQESDDEKLALIRDCNELRNTLKEVEKSRRELRKELNNEKINGSTLKSELKTKDNEIKELQLINNKNENEKQIEFEMIKAKLNECENARESLRVEVNSVKHHANELEQLLKLEKSNLARSEKELKRLYNSLVSLESTRQSLTQLREKNLQLSLQNKQLHAQANLSEIERREAEKRLNSSTLIADGRDSELLLLKSEITSLKEKITKIESEKKRLERCYSQMEKEKSTLKHTLDELHRKSNIPLMNSPKNKDSLIDEAKIISHGLAALELKNNELQRKVSDLQTLMNDADVSVAQTNSNTLTNSKKECDRLKSAQKQAQELLDKSTKHSISNLEKELSYIKDQYQLSPNLTSTPSRFKEPPKRTSGTTSTPLHSQSSGLQNTKRKLEYNDRV